MTTRNWVKTKNGVIYSIVDGINVAFDWFWFYFHYDTLQLQRTQHDNDIMDIRNNRLFVRLLSGNRCNLCILYRSVAMVTEKSSSPHLEGSPPSTDSSGATSVTVKAVMSLENEYVYEAIWAPCLAKHFLSRGKMCFIVVIRTIC